MEVVAVDFSVGHECDRIKENCRDLRTTMTLNSKTQFICADLEVHGSLVGQVGFVSWQSDDYIRAGLSL